jgi:hypothetical protein
LTFGFSRNLDEAAAIASARIDRIMPLSESAAAHRLLEEHAAEIYGEIVVMP